MRHRLLTAGLVAIGLAACQSTQAPQTASGRPEVTVPGAAPAQVKAALVNKMLDKGYRIVRDEPFLLVTEKPVEDAMAKVLFSTRISEPMARVTFTVAEASGGTRVVADMAVISNAGTGMENRTDVSQGAQAPRVQAFLDQVATEATAKPEKKRRG